MYTSFLYWYLDAEATPLANSLIHRLNDRLIAYSSEDIKGELTESLHICWSFQRGVIEKVEKN